MSEKGKKVEQEPMTDDDQRALRNAVFAAKQAAEGGGGLPQAQVHNRPEVTREEYARRELGFDIPVDVVPLPSAGKVYSSDHPLHNNDRVEYRAMTAKEEDILMSRAFIKKGTVITELIRSCLMNRNIDVNSLLSGDRNALMVAIRSSGYGNQYEPQFTCPSCTTNNDLSVDLAELPIKPLGLEPAHPFANVFHFKLPVSKKTVGFKFLTGAEEELILKSMEARKKKGLLNDNVVTTRLLHSIVEIEGNSDKGQVARFVQYMPARDSLELRKYIDDHEPGVDMTIDFQCNFCDFGQEMQLPIGPSFFWPSSRR
jgi:hypothetical protein